MGTAVPASGGPPPYQGKPDEYLSTLADCLRQAGFTTEITPDGGLKYSFGSAAQRPAFEAAKRDCDQRIGVPPPPARLSDAQLAELYDSLVASRACLLDLGYAVPPPPSKDTFIDSYESDPWSPYNDVAVTSASAWSDINRECPQP